MTISFSLHPHYENLLISLNQLDALLCVATSMDVTELKTETAFHYLWLTSDVLQKAKKICEELAQLNVLH